MRYQELFEKNDFNSGLEESERDAEQEVKSEMPYKVSPFSIPNKNFIMSRATGPLGARTKDGYVKDKYQKILKPTYNKEQVNKPDTEDQIVLDIKK